MSIIYNQINISFNNDIKICEKIYSNIINIYNSIAIFKNIWNYEYEFIENVDNNKIKFYINEYKKSNNIKNELLKFSNNEKEIIHVYDKKYNSYELLIAMKKENYRNIIITKSVQNVNISFLGIVGTLSLTSIILFYSKNYLYASIFLISKLITDYKISKINITKIKLFKYLETKNLIKFEKKNNIITI